MGYNLFKAKKAQIGGPAQMIIGLFIALMVIGILQMVSVLTTSKVAASIDRTSFYVPTNVINESVAVVINAGADNSTLLSFAGFLTNSESVFNKTGGTKLVRDTDYKIFLQGAGATGNDLTTIGNFTWLNKAYNFSNTTGVFVSYVINLGGQANTAFNNLESNTYNSYALGGTAQIVLAAITIVATVFGIFYMVNRG